MERPIRIYGWAKGGVGGAYPGTINTSAIMRTEPGFTHYHDGGLLLSHTPNRSLEYRAIEFVDTAIACQGGLIVKNCYLRSSASTKMSRISGISAGAIIDGCQIEASGWVSHIGHYSLLTNCFITDANLINADTQHVNDLDIYCIMDVQNSTAHRNIFAVTGNNTCMTMWSGIMSHNSILCTDGSALKPAISTNALGGDQTWTSFTNGGIFNNIVEGFREDSGYYPTAFVLTDGRGVRLFAGNAAYNNATDYDLNATYYGVTPAAPHVIAIEYDNESLSGSPFAKSGALTFDNRLTYFAPNNVGNVLAGAYNGQGILDKGAVQTSTGGGGGGGGSDMLTNPGMAGGMRG
jgi:hypothetical protein